MKAFDKELHALKVNEIRILEGLKLSVYHEGDVQHVYGNLPSEDLYYIIKQYKMLDVKYILMQTFRTNS